MSDVPKDLSKVYMARFKFHDLNTKYAEVRAKWARACTADSEGTRLQAVDLLAEATRLDSQLAKVQAELFAVTFEAQAAGLL